MNNERGPERIRFTAEAALRRSGGRAFRVRLFDLSAEGCKIEFIERPAIGERVWVRFGALQAVEGTVRWIDGHIGGVQFERPLYEPVFQQLIR
jgi:PilZ domain